MAKILDGKSLMEQLAPDLAEKAKMLPLKPQLVIIQIAKLGASNTYIRKKKEFAQKIGVSVLHKKYSEGVKEGELLAQISEYNLDPQIHGIILQLPIPDNLDPGRIIEAIDQRKDVDGLTAKNTKLLFDNKEAFLPAATQGILTLLEQYNIDIYGKKVVIVGGSSLVGRPTALAFLNRKATVTVCHSHTENLEEESLLADILIVGVGKVGLISSSHVKKGQIVIDVGISVTKGKRVLGDVDYEEVEKIVSAITPVPGGVGPMTVFSLFENLIKAYIRPLMEE